MSKALRTALDKALISYVRKFEKAHGVEFDWATNDDLMGMLCFGDHYFNISDIIYDVDEKCAVGLIFEWQDAGIEAHFKGNDKVINLQSYVSGMRYE
mgnify:CR=1 FL=1